MTQIIKPWRTNNWSFLDEEECQWFFCAIKSNIERNGGSCSSLINLVWMCQTLDRPESETLNWDENKFNELWSLVNFLGLRIVLYFLFFWHFTFYSFYINYPHNKDSYEIL